MMRMKRLVSLLLVVCLTCSAAFAEEEKPRSIWGSIGGWFSHAAESTAGWASKTWHFHLGRSRLG